MVKPGMTLAELDQQVLEAVEGGGGNDQQQSGSGGSREGLRNEAIATALLSVVVIDKLPESLMEENTMMRFQDMLSDFQQQVC